MKKILEARKFIKTLNLKKEGKNSYSNYDYYTPEQVSLLVSKACEKNNILPIFSLCKDELGLFGKIEVYDCEKNEVIVKTEMRTEKPEIKATVDTQQMGGCSTYTKRYMLMSLFDIEDNNLDFDSHDNKPKKINKVQEKVTTKQNSIATGYECSDCAIPIVKKVYDYSIEHKGKALCYDCQHGGKK